MNKQTKEFCREYGTSEPIDQSGFRIKDASNNTPLPKNIK